MSKEAKSPTKRDQALNDATQGQFGNQPSPEPEPNVDRKDQSKNTEDVRKLAERRKYYLTDKIGGQ